MKTIQYLRLFICQLFSLVVIFVSCAIPLYGFSLFPASIAHAENYLNLDLTDTTAVWGCWDDTDENDNPIQTCGYGHEDNGIFNPLPTPGSVLFKPVADQLLATQPVLLHALWNNKQLENGATTTSSMGPGTLSWSITPNPQYIWALNHYRPNSLDDVLDTATLTLDVYQGDIGSSMLFYSTTLSSSSPQSISLTINNSGPYFIAFSATYPSGNYPPGKSPEILCLGSGDFCPVPNYSLSDFRNAMTHGADLEESAESLGNYTPAAYGIISTTLMSTPVAPSISASNVLFLPGTLTSRLYMKNKDGSERELWEPRSNLDVGPLAMNPDGTSKNLIYTRDIVDQLYSNNQAYGVAVRSAVGDTADLYGPFEKFMDSLVSDGTIKQWSAYPYDWRYDVSDIIANGTLVGTSTTTPEHVYLQNVLQTLASSSPSGKVTIVAHSNGGLLAKALAIDLEKKGKSGLIDHIILIGAPQFGTPKTVVDMLHGSEFTQLGGLIMYGNSVRAAEATMPGVYGLLPSAAYFANAPLPIVTFATNQPASLYRNTLGASITTIKTLFDFLSDSHALDTKAGLKDDLKTPIALSTTLLKKEERVHAAIDTWVPSSGIDVRTITGWGQLTPYQINYSSTSGLSCDRTNFFTFINCTLSPQLQSTLGSSLDGDDTVVAESSVGLTTDNLFFNLNQFEKDGKGIIVHKNLMSALPVQIAIKNSLLGVSTTNPYLSTHVPQVTPNPLTVVSAHSPVDLIATDSDGKQTGIFSVSNLPSMYFQKEEIPGSSIQVIDDEKYLYLPTSSTYTLSMQGYDSGITTIDVGTVNSSGATTTSEFADIPTTASTTSVFSVGPEGSTPIAIQVDIQGTGSTTPITNATNFMSTNVSYRSARFILREWLAGLRPDMRNHLVKYLQDFLAIKATDDQSITRLEKLISILTNAPFRLPRGILITQLLHDLRI